MEKVMVVRMAAIGKSKVATKSKGNGVEVGNIPNLEIEVDERWLICITMSD